MFVDPDNGLPRKTAVATCNSGQKYVFPDDLAGFVQRGQSLVIYHHRTRERGGLATQIERGFTMLRGLDSGTDPWAVVFRRRTVRVYFVLPSGVHVRTVRPAS